MMLKNFSAQTDSPITSLLWRGYSDEVRIEIIRETLGQVGAGFNNLLQVISAKEDGQIVVKILNSLSAGARGTLLLDFEEHLKQSVDDGLTVWAEALGDKNSLRNLRGIEVKVL